MDEFAESFDLEPYEVLVAQLKEHLSLDLPGRSRLLDEARQLVLDPQKASHAPTLFIEARSVSHTPSQRTATRI